MRVVSMVPSWTETLIEAGVDVVGRTRFCIHPSEKVKAIPTVGGTKDIEWEKVKLLKPDLILLDREENPKSMHDESTYFTHVTHVQNIKDVARELRIIADQISKPSVKEIAGRWENVLMDFKPVVKEIGFEDMSESDSAILGIEQWINKPTSNVKNVVYVIWKNPYMAVTHETFIGSMIHLLGFQTSVRVETHKKPYPEIRIEDFDRQDTLFLFSSEPFPFHRKIEELKTLNVFSAIVDGEKYSWFGERSLKFLESIANYRK